jgi:hypothetical protein
MRRLKISGAFQAESQASASALAKKNLITPNRDVYNPLPLAKKYPIHDVEIALQAQIYS